MIVLLTILVILFVWLVISLLSCDWKRKRYRKNDDYIFQKAVRKCNLWLIAPMFWMISEYVFTIIPFESTVIVVYLDAYKPYQNNEIILYSIISLAFIVFGFAINPKRYMRSYRNAYVKIDHSIDIYIEKSTNKDDRIAQKELIDILHECEQIINYSYDIE